MDLWFLFLKQQIYFIAFLYHQNQNISLILEQEIKKKQYVKNSTWTTWGQNLKYDIDIEKQIYNWRKSILEKGKALEFFHISEGDKAIKIK